jgi:hypothetical protein
MFKVKGVLLSLAAIAVVGAGALASSASAAINFEWKVEGKKLAEIKTFDASNGSKSGVLQGTLGGSSLTILFTALTIHNGRVLILPPGLDGTVLFLNLVVHKSPKCLVSGNAIKTEPLKAEIVEGASGGVGNNEVDLVFAPEKGATIAKVEFVNNGTEECALKNQTFNLAGLFLALSLPQKTEVVRQDLDIEARTKEYKNSKGELKTAGLEFGGKPATLTDLVLVLLTSGEKFGPF